MAQNFEFKFGGGSPVTGWTAQSIVGPVNAKAQAPLTATDLNTTPSTLVDPTLGSRSSVNPNTGIRDPVLSASVYSQPDVPAYLSQAVAALNEEQALKRSLQAEWNNRLMEGAGSGGPNSYLFAEALRAASVSPGASVGFGQRIADPAVGRAQAVAANTQAVIEADRRRAFMELEAIRKKMTGTNLVGNQYADLYTRAQELSPAGSYVGRGGSGVGGGGWTPRAPVNSFQPGYNQYWGIGM